MTSSKQVNTHDQNVAPLRNVALLNAATARLVERPAHLPGIGSFSGPSGWGKTVAGVYAANKHKSYYVECRYSWTKKALLQAILKEMGIRPEKTMFEMVEQIAQQLAASRRPLIIDEFDYVVDRGAVELIRDIHDASRASIMLIGEEQLPAKLKKWERFHNRVAVWQQAQPADIEDVRHLARLYAPGLDLADDLMQRILLLARGAIRRMVVNIENVRQEAVLQGWKQVDMQLWGQRELYTGDAPIRRAQA